MRDGTERRKGAVGRGSRVGVFEDLRLINEGLPAPARSETPLGRLHHLTQLAVEADRCARALLDEAGSLERLLAGQARGLDSERQEAIETSCLALQALIDELLAASDRTRQQAGGRS